MTKERIIEIIKDNIKTYQQIVEEEFELEEGELEIWKGGIMGLKILLSDIMEEEENETNTI